MWWARSAYAVWSEPAASAASRNVALKTVRGATSGVGKTGIAAADRSKGKAAGSNPVSSKVAADNRRGVDHNSRVPEAGNPTAGSNPGIPAEADNSRDAGHNNHVPEEANPTGGSNPGTPVDPNHRSGKGRKAGTIHRKLISKARSRWMLSPPVQQQSGMPDCTQYTAVKANDTVPYFISVSYYVHYR